MVSDILKAEAENCLIYMYQQFSQKIRDKIEYPLTEISICRVFAESVTGTITALRSTDSPMPPTALILAMIKLCHAIIDPPAEAFSAPVKPNCVPRAFAYEILDRLHAEIPPTFDFALDQVGRIVNEAGNLENEHRIRRAFRSYRARQKGALLGNDLDALVRQVWHRRYPQHQDLLQEAFLREAA